MANFNLRLPSSPPLRDPAPREKEEEATHAHYDSDGLPVLSSYFLSAHDAGNDESLDDDADSGTVRILVDPIAPPHGQQIVFIAAAANANLVQEEVADSETVARNIVPAAVAEGDYFSDSAPPPKLPISNLRRRRVDATGSSQQRRRLED